MAAARRFSGDATAEQLVDGASRRGPLSESTAGPDRRGPAARRHPAASGRLGVITVDVMVRAGLAAAST